MTRIDVGGTDANSVQSLSQVTPGDFVGVYGVVSPAKAQTINATSRGNEHER